MKVLLNFKTKHENSIIIFVVTIIIRLLYPIKGFSVTLVITINVTMIYPIKGSMYIKKKMSGKC